MMDRRVKDCQKQTFEHKVARILTHVIRSRLFIGSANEAKPHLIFSTSDLGQNLKRTQI